MELIGNDSKVLFQNILRPTASLFARLGITANQVTGATMVLSLAAGTTILLNPGDPRLLFLVPLVLLVRLAFNHIDGLLAREYGLTSPLGGVLNDICDPVSEAALFLPLAALPDVCGGHFWRGGSPALGRRWPSPVSRIRTECPPCRKRSVVGAGESRST